MGITRKQLEDLGFVKQKKKILGFSYGDTGALLLKIDRGSFILPKGKTIIFYKENDVDTYRGFIHLDYTTYTEFKDFLYEWKMDKYPRLRNQISYV